MATTNSGNFIRRPVRRLKLCLFWAMEILLTYYILWSQCRFSISSGCTNECESALHWRHDGGDCVSNHQPCDCLLNRLFRRRSKKTSNLSVTGLCEGNSPGTHEFPAQMASNAENVSIWWRHHGWNPLHNHRHHGRGRQWTHFIFSVGMS